MLKKTALLCALIICLMGLTPAHGYFITSPSDRALSCAWVDDMSHWPPLKYVSATYVGYYSAYAQDNHFRFDSFYAGQYNMTGQYLDNGTYDDNGFSSLRLNFVSPTNAFGFHWGASDYQWTLTAYDTGDNPLASYNMPITTSSNAGEFYGIATANISYALLTNISGHYDWVMIDDLHIAQPCPIPIPGAVLLLGTGLLGLLGLKRKKSIL